MSGESSNAFNPRIIGALIVAGVVGFLGYWALSAFAPELGSGRDGGGHALSRGAVGYAGMVQLLKDTGHAVSVIRDEHGQVPGSSTSDLGGLLVLTPTPETSAADIQRRLSGIDRPVLVILPKWRTQRDPRHSGWVGRAFPLDNGARNLPPEWGIRSTAPVRDGSGADLAVRLWDDPAFALPRPAGLRAIGGESLKTLVAAPGDGALLVQAHSADIYVLSDPDLINNLAMRDPRHAAAALRLLTAIAGPGEPIGFDVTLNGLGGGRSLLRLAFTPPFLGLTLCFVVAALLAGWQSAARFGPPLRVGRVVELGKAALVANSAQLIVQARRTPRFAARYGAMVREAAARRLHAPAGLAGSGLDSWLDRFADARGRRFSELLASLEAARSTADIVARAGALGEWRKDVLREHE